MPADLAVWTVRRCGARPAPGRACATPPRAACPDGVRPLQVPPAEDLGTLTRRGGRAGALRRVAEGIPPRRLGRDAGGRAVYLLLAGEDGRTVNGVPGAELATYRRVH